jgi:cell fate regulator YaaT (PSP1 superfamily)
MAQTVRVRMRKPSRVFTFISRDIVLRRNDSCVVRSDRGLEYGLCVANPEPATPQEEERFKMSVVRRASDHDDLTHRQIQMDEERAKEVCKEKIRARGMSMKLVECEYAFDRKKVIFYFTAEDRVDFRELVRDLAREFKARIELRHIQVRDEAKIVGGIGSCGRELCCTTWMREFLPISMKMAKRQNLSLNPSKISGQCGRLLCCLAYENDLYQHGRRIDIPEKSGEPDLGALRDDMEEHPGHAVDALRESTLGDVLEDETVRAWSEPEPDAPVEEFTAVTGEDDDDSADATADEGQTESPQDRPPQQGRGRRRRRRGRGGRPGGGPSRN